MTLYNNIIFSTSSSDPWYSTNYSGLIISDYNCWYGNSSQGKPEWDGTHSIISDPLFIDIEDGNFSIGASSPCIDAGTPGASQVVAIGFDGITRPRGSGYDIGAYEYASDTSSLYPTIAHDVTSNISISYTQGTNPAAQSLHIWNSGPGTLNYTLTCDADWILLSPSEGSSSGEHDTITIAPSTAGLVVGDYQAVITITSTDEDVSNSPQTINALVSVAIEGDDDGGNCFIRTSGR